MARVVKGRRAWPPARWQLLVSGSWRPVLLLLLLMQLPLVPVTWGFKPKPLPLLAWACPGGGRAHAPLTVRRWLKAVR